MLYLISVDTVLGVLYRNQWYDAKGFGKDIKWAYGPWHFNIEEHLLNDGILHPCSKDHRTLLFPSGNLGWIQMYLKPNDPNSVIFSEPMFYVSKYLIPQLHNTISTFSFRILSGIYICSEFGFESSN